ncbi:Gfo/Idh/MocA family protein [Dyadobacter psychrotolerans]|uniref:Gfo/Idh/MocA family oxidoreductase n=1 Tax=Dyadobacter psychrotolerans TaxID=2541721 RepID=A0A4R5DLN6_9BACT|nr:Gfo/Idh/MocA family oxidoreductase [Dyadobacter psychrotolerans]TDE12891.1 Gfo/Idh/MocA family oxidoreductase [Dyadobacter psychrotolerans]
MKSGQERRSFLKKGLLGGLGLYGISNEEQNNPDGYDIPDFQSPPAVGKSVVGLKVAPIKQVRVALIGIGARGSGHVMQFASLFPDKAKVVAVCDILPERAAKSVDQLKAKGQDAVAYSGKPEAWKDMLKRDDIDLVVIATPWRDHTPMAVYAMQQGKHVVIEVPAALTLDECWQLVNTAEATQRNCMMMENVCYGDEELWVLNMVQKEVFGTLTYAEAAYIHNLTDLMLSQKGYYEFWRLKENIAHDGNLYPMHGLGPVAQYLEILRGDRFEHIVSMSSLEASLSESMKKLPADHPYAGFKGKIRHGDMNTSLIKTNKGRMITLKHDVVTPRPYDRINALAGTHAYHEGYPSRLSILDKGHSFLKEADYNEYKSKYKHPIWDKLKKEIEVNGGHGGMDFVLIYRIIDALNNGRPMDMDVYDAATWSSVIPLSEVSVNKGNSAVKFPDFTRGKWSEKRELGIMTSL